MSKNKKLVELDCYDNNIKSLNVSGCTKLQMFYCDDNKLSSLDVSTCKALTELYCSENALTSIDVSYNVNLECLYCSHNLLKSIDVSNNTWLRELWCGDNQITSLDVRGNLQLEQLGIYGNSIKTVDVRNNKGVINAIKNYDEKYIDEDYNSIEYFFVTTDEEGESDRELVESIDKNTILQTGPLFADVPLTHSFARSVYWAYNEGITGGKGNTGRFAVNEEITRGQVVTFLWRAAGQPEPKKKTQTFKDVPTTHNFYKAIQWASEQGITGGYTGKKAGYFGPADNCTRGQIVTFMWRFAGNPAPKGDSQTFPDVSTKHNFYKAVQWAYENAITTGYKNGKFGVNDTCTRGQCVTFLYRLMHSSLFLKSYEDD